MSIYEKTNVARALLYWAKNNNGNEAYYLEDRMYAVADGDMVIILTADSYDEAIRKAKARHTQGDTISREALKKELNSRVFQDDYATTLLLSSFNDIIDSAPTVNPCKNCDLYFKAMTKEEMKEGGAV